MENYIEIDGTIQNSSNDEFEIEITDPDDINKLYKFGIKDNIIKCYTPKNIKQYKDLNLVNGVQVKIIISKDEDGNNIVNLKKYDKYMYNYDRQKLSNYLDVLLKHNKVNYMIPLLLVEREQAPITSEDFSIDKIKDFIKDDELFTTNPSYQNAIDVDLYDNSGKLLCSIKSDNDISGINFVFPFDSIECREAFLNLCDEIQHHRAIRYPNKSKE